MGSPSVTGCYESVAFSCNPGAGLFRSSGGQSGDGADNMEV